MNFLRKVLPNQRSKLSGQIDAVEGRTIRGWLRVAGRERATVQVFAVDNGQLLTEVVADLPRDDLLAAGIGDGKYAFDITIDHHGDEALLVEVREAVSAFSLGRVQFGPKRPYIDGYVDGVSGRTIYGWAREPKHIDQRVSVRIIAVDSGEVLAESCADMLRNDLLSAGIGDGCHAFSVTVNARDDEALLVEVQEAKSGYSLGRVQLAAAEAYFEGHIDRISGRTIFGWVRNPARPEQRVSIQIIAVSDGDVLAETVADLLRSDLTGANIGDGRHAFSVSVEARSEETLQVEVRETETGFSLGQAELAAVRAVIDAGPQAQERRNQLLASFINSVRINRLIKDNNTNIHVLYADILSRYKLLDEAFYKAKYGKLLNGDDPLVHYITVGSNKSFLPNAYFDPAEYLALNPDVRPAGIDPIVHYFLFGWTEGRATGSFFDGAYYLKRYDDVRTTGINPLYHFLAFGQYEGRSPKYSVTLPTTTRDMQFGARTSGRIVLVSHDFDVGGAQQLLRSLAEWLLATTKYDVCFVAPRDGGHRHLFEAIAPVHVLPEALSDQAVTELRNFIGPTIRAVFINSIVSARFFDFWEENTPAVCYVHELQKIIDMFPRSIELLKQRCITFIGGSEAVTANLKQNHHIDEKRVRLIYDFIGSVSSKGRSSEKYVEQRKALGVSPDDFLVMGCGVMHWRKSPDKFIEVASRVVQQTKRSCRFVWIGGGPDEEACRELVKEKGLSETVSLIGYRENVPELLEAADLFLLPSEEDPFPLVCLYAASKEVPVVCFDDAGGIPEFTAKGCGISVPFGDVVAMASAVTTYIDDPDLKDSHGAEGLKQVRDGFTVTTAGPRILEILRDAMATPPHISVVVPNYNYDRYLDQRLSTIYSQTFQDFEVILLDDASPDNSVAVLTDWAKKYPATRLIVNERNSNSPFAQWLKGMAAARSDLIWIAEADDFCEPQLLEALVPAMDDRNVFLAHVKSVPVDAEGKVLGNYEQLYLNRIAENRWSRSYSATDHREVDAGLAIGNVIPNASAVVFRRFKPEDDFVKQVTTMRMCGDWYFYLRALRGGNVAFESQPLNYHRRHSNTVTHQTEGSLRYFDELAEIRRYISNTFCVSDDTRRKADTFSVQDLDRFRVTDERTRQHIRELSKLVCNKVMPTILVVISDLSPGGGQMFAIRLVNAWTHAGGRAILLNVGMFPDHKKVVGRIDQRVSIYDARTPDFSLGRLIADCDIDVVHSSLWWSDRFVHEHRHELSEKVAWCITTHGCYETLIDKPHTDASFPRRFPEMLERVDEWIYIADKNLGVFDRYGYPERLSKINNGFEPEEPVELSKKSLGVREDSLVLLLVSRAIAEKGWFEAVEATKRLNHAGVAVDLMLLGEGPAAEALRNEETSPFVHLYGHVENVQDYIKVADIGVLPSYFTGESMPLVIIEMMAQGKPVVASNVGDIASMLTTSDKGRALIAGSVIPLADGKLPVNALVDAIMLLADPEARESAGAVGSRIFYERFTMSAMLKHYDRIYAANLTKRRLQVG